MFLDGAHGTILADRAAGRARRVRTARAAAGRTGQSDGVSTPGGPVDVTGAGDSFVAVLAAALLRGADPGAVARLGGRPRLGPAEVAGVAAAAQDGPGGRS